MEILSLVMRLLHVLFAILWVGFTLTIVVALGPIMMALASGDRKAFQLQFLPRQKVLGGVGAIGTLVTGLWLGYVTYMGASGIGFGNDRGYWIILGSVLALGAWMIGLKVFLPGVTRLQALLQAGGDPSEIAALGAKLGKMAPIALFHMLAAAVCMLAATHGLAFSALNLIVILGTGVAFGLASVALGRKIKA